MLHPIFMECTAQENTARYFLEGPFEYEGFYVATNGRICVRMPKFDGGPIFDIPGEKSAPNILALPWDRSLYLPKPHVITNPPSPPTYRDCEACDGKGRRTCNMGHVHDCNGCNDGKVYVDGRYHLVDDIYIRSSCAQVLFKYQAHVQFPRDKKYTLYFSLPGTPIEGLLIRVEPPTEDERE